MLDALKIRLRTGQKARSAFTVALRGRDAFTLKQRERRAFTLLPPPYGRCAFTFAKPRGQNAFTWRGRSPLRSCRDRLLAKPFGVVRRLPDEGGFTLLELLVVMAL